MRLLIQRVKRAGVSIDGMPAARIGPGICAFLGVAREDSQEKAEYLAHKLVNLRIFPGGGREFERSVLGSIASFRNDSA